MTHRLWLPEYPIKLGITPGTPEAREEEKFEYHFVIRRIGETAVAVIQRYPLQAIHQSIQNDGRNLRVDGTACIPADYERG